MSTQLTNNDRLRALVKASGLSMPVALTVFNRGLGARALSVSAWKALVSDRPPAEAMLDDEFLLHAEQQFARVAPALTTSP